MDVTSVQDHLDELEAEKERLRTQLATTTKPIIGYDDPELMRLALDRATEMILWHGEDGRFVYANQAACKQLGYTYEELLELSMPDIDLNFTLEAAQQVWQSLETQGTLTIETTHRRKDGSIYPASVNINALSYAGQRLLFVFVQDISERKHNEQELQHYRDIINSTPIGIAEAPTSTGLLSYVNPAYCQMLGYTHEELIGLSATQVFAEAPETIEEFARICAEQGIWQGELRYRRKDGSTFPVHVTANTLYHPDGTPNVAIGFVYDLSVQQEQAEQLQLNRFTVENAADAIGWYDLSGKVLYLNKAAFDLYGYTPADLEHLYARDIDPDFTEEMLISLTERLKHEGSILTERVHRHRDGSEIPVEATNNYLAFNGKEYIAVVIRDIRERKAAEAEREALQQQIIAAQREALRELSSPLIPITDHVVVMPLIGTIDSARAQQVMEALLEGVARYQADLVILDITGVQVVDTQVAQAFIQSAQAVRLLGAQVMITGIQPQIAQTLVHLGVDLSSIRTAGSLQDGIAAALNGKRRN